MRNGNSWNCPNGHSQCYTKSELDKALEKIKRLEGRNSYLARDNDSWRNSYFTMEKSRASYMGHFTRLKNKYEPIIETEKS